MTQSVVVVTAVTTAVVTASNTYFKYKITHPILNKTKSLDANPIRA